MTVVAIIGAGPAGMAAAETALSCGAHAVVIDLNEAPGGQYDRQLPADYRAARPQLIHHDWPTFVSRRDAVLANTRCQWIPNTSVFLVERMPNSTPILHLLTGVTDGTKRVRRTLQPDAVILAAGAHDRVVPFPGWTLPGVYTAGAAQTLARTERVALGRRAIVSGSGPFLLPVAQSLTDVGTEVVEVLEANTSATLARGWLARPHRLGAHRAKTRDLAVYAAHMILQRIPWRTGKAVIRVIGDDRVEAAITARLDEHWRPIPGSESTIAVDTVCVGHGFSPSHELALAAGCRMRIAAGGAFVSVGDDQQTSVSGIYAAGEMTGIAGADAAAAEGAVAGYAATGHFGSVSKRLLRRRNAARDFAERLSGAHPIGDGWHDWLEDTTLICRCEGTALADLRADHSAERSPLSTRLNTRAGLGPCQGRFCESSIDSLCHAVDGGDGRGAEGIAAANIQSRPIAQPIRLGELASPPRPD